MNKVLLYSLGAALLTACAPNRPAITVENPSDFPRESETVEVALSALSALSADFGNALYVLKDVKGREVPYQLLYENGLAATLVFPVDIPAGTTAAYYLEKGVPSEVKPRTYARYVPERKDDLAWENDLAAYRMYGPALAAENPGNGVDLWLKCTDEPVVDKFYYDELCNGLSYHVDRGLGLDCYSVGHTLGAGGISPYTSRLWVGGHYTAQHVAFTGPLRSEFTLTYDSVQVDGKTYRQSLTITVSAGSLFNKVLVTYEGEDAPIRLAAGIFLHNGEGTEFISEKYPVIAYAEQAVSEAGLPAGRCYTAVCMPGGSNPEHVDKHFVLTTAYKPGDTLTYYFGGGWSKWKFPTDNDWFRAVERFARAIEEPLRVTVQQAPGR
ncbi:MAG: DUF4861 domain-containing protein [Tannerellaceae bacterium]|jgi:hypothetical protein|nr:DUF4861 domain-containing protein [Tannerellaceae bacterium]